MAEGLNEWQRSSDDKILEKDDPRNYRKDSWAWVQEEVHGLKLKLFEMFWQRSFVPEELLISIWLFYGFLSLKHIEASLGHQKGDETVQPSRVDNLHKHDNAYLLHRSDDVEKLVHSSLKEKCQEQLWGDDWLYC